MHDNQDAGDRLAPPTSIALAEALLECNRRGLRLTELRQRVLKLLWKAERPRGAYELLPLLKSETGQSLTAASAYRTLDFLLTHGFVHRIESRNAFLPCAHPGHAHACLFFLCTDCGHAAEVEHVGVEGLLEREAAARGFHVKRPVIEIEGTCKTCAVLPKPVLVPNTMRAAS
jgi:Fur family transcriptional regulator, zinc uptake regulator